MGNDILNDLKKKRVQSLVKTCMEAKLSAEFSPATRMFYRMQLEALRVRLLAWEKIFSCCPGNCCRISLMCFYFYLVSATYPFSAIQCYHHFCDHKILYPHAPKPIQMKLRIKHRILLDCPLQEKTISLLLYVVPSGEKTQ